MRTPASAVAAAASVYSEGKIPPILSNQEKWKQKHTYYKFTIITFYNYHYTQPLLLLSTTSERFTKIQNKQLRYLNFYHKES